jgi:hypothetical protein
VGGLLAHHTEGALVKQRTWKVLLTLLFLGLTAIILLALLEELGFSV